MAHAHERRKDVRLSHNFLMCVRNMIVCYMYSSKAVEGSRQKKSIKNSLLCVFTSMLRTEVRELFVYGSNFLSDLKMMKFRVGEFLSWF